MSCDLEVDTGKLRHAAAKLRDAAELLDQPAHLPIASSLETVACHGSAPLREALCLVIRRAEESVSAAARLADLSVGAAGNLDSVATRFDAAESACTAGW